MSAREAVADLVETSEAFADYDDTAGRILAAIEASGEYVRVEALLGYKAVEAGAETLLSCLNNHPMAKSFAFDDAWLVITAAIETVKKGDV